jgi:hypothetical protein
LGDAPTQGGQFAAGNSGCVTYSTGKATTIVRLKQELDGKRLKLVYDGQHKSLRVAQADEGLQWMYSFWFAWYAFRPHTDVYLD